MKKMAFLLIFALLLAGCKEEPKKEPDPDLLVTAKPAIYIYPEEVCYEKPVIYAYPEMGMPVSVKLDYRGELTTTYPAYNDGWEVLARPDGTLTDPETGREYYCLYWEGVTDTVYDFSEGFVVSGEDSAAFLEEALATLGLSAREANEFIIYWLPRLEANPYNLITFQSEAYTDSARLTIDPAPDTLIRVFMAWRGLDAPIDIAPQTLEPVVREGFTVVEWGGTEVIS